MCLVMTKIPSCIHLNKQGNKDTKRKLVKGEGVLPLSLTRTMCTLSLIISWVTVTVTSYSHKAKTFSSSSVLSKLTLTFLWVGSILQMNTYLEGNNAVSIRKA